MVAMAGSGCRMSAISLALGSAVGDNSYGCQLVAVHFLAAS